MQADMRTARIVSGWAAGVIAGGIAFWLYGRLAVAVSASVGGQADLADPLCQWIPAQVIGLIVGYPIGTGRRPRGLAAGAVCIAIIVTVYSASQAMIDPIGAGWLSMALTALLLAVVLFLILALSFLWVRLFGWSEILSIDPKGGER